MTMRPHGAQFAPRFENYSGFIVCGEALDGADAIEKALKLHPDLILLDLAMPNLNGVEAASVLKGLQPLMLCLLNLTE